jgi:hypothetical protein
MMPIPDDLKPLVADVIRRDHAAINALADRLSDLGGEAIAAVLGYLVGFPCPLVAQMPLTDFLRIQRLSVRVRTAIFRLFRPDLNPGITLADLCSKNAEDFLVSGNFGMTSLIQLREILADHGLFLRGEFPSAKRSSSAYPQPARR